MIYAMGDDCFGELAHHVPLSCEVRDDGSVVMESRGDGVLRSCERTWDLKPLANGQFEGTFIGIIGKFVVNLTRKQ